MAHEVVHEARREQRRAPKRERAPAHQPRNKAAAKKRPVSGKPVMPEHAVFLVPGLLGFERFATFGYFADRVVAAVRAGLEHIWEQPVPVVPTPIPPTDSLRDRQRKLVKTLADRLHALEHEHQPLNVHLLGHSTGGVDCDLLTHETPVGDGTWDDVDPRAEALRERIRSVVTIASPHQGACITRDPIARFMQQRDPRGVPELAKLSAEFVASALSDVELTEFLFSAKREGVKSWGFLQRVLSRWDLIGDLQPSRRASRAVPKRDVLRRTFVTIAGRPRPGTGIHQADGFFRELSERAAGWRTGCAEEGENVQASVARLQRALSGQQADDLVIKTPGVELPAELDAGHNDGVVNAARQLIDPHDPDELAGIVVADHFDVIGYYDRRVWIADEVGNERSAQVLSGLLHSGSGFRDPQFFDLYRRIAAAIAEVAQS